jgi:hypothetical protein
LGFIKYSRDQPLNLINEGRGSIFLRSFQLLAKPGTHVEEETILI